MNHWRAYSLPVGESSTADHPQWHLRFFGFTFRHYNLFHKSANNCLYFRKYLIGMQKYDIYRTSVRKFWCQRRWSEWNLNSRPSAFRSYALTNWYIGPTMELKHSRRFMHFIQIIQWNSYSDRVARLYLPVLRNAFKIIVGLIDYQLGGQVPLTTRNDISAPSELHFGIIVFFTRLLTIIYIFGNIL